MSRWVVGGLGSVGAKLNVVQKCWLRVSACTSFNFAKHWDIFCFCQSVDAITVGRTITDNGKSIGEVRDFEELKVQGIQNVADIFSMK